MNINISDDYEINNLTPIDEVIDFYGAKRILISIGTIDDWIKISETKEVEVVLWLESQGYKVEIS